MPKCGANVINCDIPIRIDSYIGCEFNCAYCNEHIKGRSAGQVFIGEGIRSLREFIRGKRTVTTAWCDWDLPLHWGILSDPFQPCEVTHRRSLKYLREFAESGYPVIVSTKNPGMLLERDYSSLLRHCNVVLQVSMTSPAYDKWEDCPSFRDRFVSLYGLSKRVKRLLVRIQPYTLDVRDDVIRMLPNYAASGVYGIMVEGLKANKRTDELTEHFGSSMVYPLDVLTTHFAHIKNAAHRSDLKFYSAENRLRHMGDSVTCCGVDGLDGFVPNVANVNHMPVQYTDRMLQPGTGRVFRSKEWTKETDIAVSKQSYKEAMESFIQCQRANASH